MGSVRLVLLVLAVLLVAAQLVPVTHTNPPVTADVAAPADVAPLLRRACYACHSNETVWPWYAHVAPVSWLLAHDVGEGREEVDFSTWDAYSPGRRAKKLERSVQEIAGGDMPPWYYVLVHPEARLDARQRDVLRNWATAEAARLRH
jgi:hypothetical protein